MEHARASAFFYLGTRLHTVGSPPSLYHAHGAFVESHVQALVAQTVAQKLVAASRLASPVDKDQLVRTTWSEFLQTQNDAFPPTARIILVQRQVPSYRVAAFPVLHRVGEDEHTIRRCTTV